MEKLEKKIFELGFDEYTVVKGEYLLVYKKYNYYNEVNEDNFKISPYYIASNFSYFKSKEIIEYIEKLGFDAQLCNHEVYDEYLELSGGIRGKNNLFFFEGLGSLFCVQLIKTNYPLQNRKLNGIACKNCNRCVKVCPMGALSDNGLDAKNCIRCRMDNVKDVELTNKMTQLLGCDECQKNCPNNKFNVNETSYDEFNKVKILKGDLTGVKEIIGSNMARKKRLIYQAMCVCANKNYDQFKEHIKVYENDEMLKEVALLVCEKLC